MSIAHRDDHVTLYHGDCRDLLRSMKADALVTDPPYGIAWSRATWNDDPDQYPVLVRWLVDAAADVVSDGWCFVFQSMLNVERFGDWFPDGYRIFAAAKNFVQMRPIEVQYAWDPVVFWRHGEGRKAHRKDAGVVTRDFHVGNVAGMMREKAGHPSPRPLDTMQHLVLLATTPERPVVIDPFAGSGTTLVAARSVGRKAIGIEVDERYCEVAANRLRQEVLGLSA
jgi:site-specific DNA-methyltransferase (adenine-specific)